MTIHRIFHRYMNEAGAEGAAGGAAPAAPEAAPPAGAPAPAAQTLIESAAGAPPAGENFIPEKLRVMKDDGTVDTDASARKLAEAYGNLEKRFGSGDAPPADPSKYVVTVPDALKEAFDPATDEGMQGFLAEAHKAGLNQAQVDMVMGKYFEMAPKLAAGAAIHTQETASAELKKAWATDADFSRNLRNANVAATAAAQKAGIDLNAVMGGELGNNPTFLRLMAALGPEFSEDPGTGQVTMATQDDINSMMSSEAYGNPRHADHAKVSAKVSDFFKRKYGNEAAA